MAFTDTNSLFTGYTYFCIRSNTEHGDVRFMSFEYLKTKVKQILHKISVHTAQ